MNRIVKIKQLSICALVIFTSALSPVFATTDAYIIKLISSSEVVDKSIASAIGESLDLTISSNALNEKANTRYILRAGYFDSYSQALRVAERYFQDSYPDFWIEQIANYSGALPEQHAELGTSQEVVASAQSSNAVIYNQDFSASPDNQLEMTATETSIDSTLHFPGRFGQVNSLIHGDFSDQANSQHSRHDLGIGLLYMDIGQEFAFRWGRQSASGGGMLGSFDGARLSYPLNKRISISMATGFPVVDQDNETNIDTYFYSISSEIKKIARFWDLHGFAITQTQDGIADRQAVGGAAHFSHDRIDLALALDYDLLFHKLNVLAISSDWRLPNESTELNVSAEHRLSRILQTSNALIGSSDESLVSLKEARGTQELFHLAQSQSDHINQIKLKLSQQINPKHKAIVSLGLSQTLNANESSAVDFNRLDRCYSVQWLGSDLIRQGDLTSVIFEYQTTASRDDFGINLKEDFPLSDELFIYSRLQGDYLRNKEDAGQEWTLQPSLGIKYALNDQWYINVNGDYRYGSSSLNGDVEKIRSYLYGLQVKHTF